MQVTFLSLSRYSTKTYLNLSVMKNANKYSEINKNFDQLISKLSEKEILDVKSMGYVKGGTAEGEGDGGEVIIIKPKF